MNKISKTQIAFYSDYLIILFVFLEKKNSEA